MTRIKLCGLTRLSDIEAVNAFRPDYAGFVFWEKSKRYVTRAEAACLKEALDPAIQAVGVFLNADIGQVISLLQDGIIDIAQLHGDETEEQIRFIQDATKKPVIRAIKVKTAADVALANATCADYLLLDGGAGDGKTFDWQLLSDVTRPFLLAGGLTPANVAEAIRLLHPWGVDVSSGIETNGLKDYQKMADFISAVRKEEEHD